LIQKDFYPQSGHRRRHTLSPPPCPAAAWTDNFRHPARISAQGKNGVRHHFPLFGNALWLEYEDLLGRPVWTDATTSKERRQVLAALARVGRWVNIYYGWRPNLPDEADNHLIELAMAGGAAAIITHNVRDIRRGELLLNGLRVHTPAEYLEETR
jgi:predicted nucleic acid-binding protein